MRYEHPEERPSNPIPIKAWDDMPPQAREHYLRNVIEGMKARLQEPRPNHFVEIYPKETAEERIKDALAFLEHADEVTQ